MTLRTELTQMYKKAVVSVSGRTVQLDTSALFLCSADHDSMEEDDDYDEDREDEDDEDYYYTDEHDPKTQAALDVEFPTWYYSTHGLSRPSSPLPEDKER